MTSGQRADDLAADTEEEPEYAAPATRIALRPHDPHTGEEIGRDEVRRGYEYERGQFVTFAGGAEGDWMSRVPTRSI